ncbi:uncharacterized protein TNCV_3204271 [Trichonephila clavipes]|nr:uncharacterized protein TNCV_3204271 [Trichonephila clavipes]
MAVHTFMCVCNSSVTAVRHRDEVLGPYVHLFTRAVDPNLILMDDNARPYTAHLFDEFLESEDIRRMCELATVRSAGCKCLPFLLVKSAREVPAFRFFPEKDKEEVSSVFTCNVKEARELKERQETREYELERLRLSNATETVSVSSADLEGQGVNRRVNLKDLVPKFDAKNADINLFFEIFERQAIKEKVAEDRWVSQLIPLLPIEIAEIVAKEPLEKSDDYPHIKNLLLARFQLTPIALRDRFESHQRRPGAMWADLVFELRSYLDNWLAGMKVGDFAALKELLVTEQIKKKEHQVN